MDPFVGEIRVFGFPFAPRGWAFCQGQTLPISQNTALYSLLGNQFGGDGRTTFGLPNLNGNVAVNAGQGPGLSAYAVGQTGGATTVQINGNQMPSHNHVLYASNTNGMATTAAGNVLAVSFTGARHEQGISGLIYSSRPITGPMDVRAIALNGGGGSHNNLQPYVVVNYCIALTGIYPQRP